MMAEADNLLSLSGESQYHMFHFNLGMWFVYKDAQLDQCSTTVYLLQEQFECPYFRILIIGRANAGKTTILEKVCGVAQGTEPIIYDKDGVEIKSKSKLLSHIKQIFGKKSAPAATHLSPSVEASQIIINDKWSHWSASNL
jgi:hypothetical protein